MANTPRGTTQSAVTVGSNVMAAAIAAAVLWTGAAAAATEAGGAAPAAFGKSAERLAIERADGRGSLVDMYAGNSEQPTVIAIHGIRGQASDLAPLIRRAAAAGNTIKTFAYDDTFRSLEDSSEDLAEALRTWAETHREAPLRIDAHSMGGRVALGALDRLSRDNTLRGRIELNLIAVPLAGVDRANWLRLLPPFLPWIRPLGDVASRYGYQRMIERVELPANVEVNVFAGGKDEVFKHSTPQYRAVVRLLRARMQVFPNATHMTTVDEVAQLR
jgi:pimeloyl-ACP methyl ester carboxylesterase